MPYANIKTGQILETLPAVLELDGRTYFGATLAQWQPLGWRKVVQTDSAPPGFAVGSYSVEELTTSTCALRVAEPIDLAAEQARMQAEVDRLAQEAQDRAGKILAGQAETPVEIALAALAAEFLEYINATRGGETKPLEAQTMLAALESRASSKTILRKSGMGGTPGPAEKITP